jgi:type IV pilus assembly protein PilM
MARSTGKSVTGLDIEPGHVTAVQTSPRGLLVERAAAAALPGGVVRDGEVVDVDTLAGTLGELFERHKLGRHVRLGLANQRIVMRTIDLPPLPDPKELASAVRFQAADHIPMPLDQVVLEHQSLGIVDTPDGQRSRVVLVAARRDMVERLLEATRQANLRPEGIDLSAFAMIRALHRGGRSTEGTTLYLSVGGVTNLAIAAGSVCVFTRVVTAGIEQMATELAERRSLTLDHARAWLCHVGLREPVSQVAGDEAIVGEARGVLLAGAGGLLGEIRNTLHFHSMQEGAAPVRQAVVTGPILAVPGLLDALREGLGMPVEAGTVTEARPGALDGVGADRAAVAAGLTVAEVPA